MLLRIRNISYYFRFIMLVCCMMMCSVMIAHQQLSRSMFMLSNVNTDAGLSSARVYSVVEAKDGAMWISTKRGVDRYNGQQVRNYFLATENQFDDASGGRNIKLVKDQHQNIYAYDNKGKVYKYNKVVNAFQLKFNLVQLLGGSLVLNEVVVDGQGRFWMALDRGVYLLNPNHKGRFVLKNTYVNHVSVIGNQLLVGSTSGVFIYSLKSSHTRSVLSGYSVLSSYHDVKAHQVWMGTFHRGVVVVDDRTWLPIRPLSSIFPSSSLAQIPQIPVRCIMPYDSHTILMAVDGAGVYAFDKQTRQTWQLLNTDGSPGSILQGNGVYTLCKDRLGDLWIGSYSGGVDLAIPMANLMEFVRHEYLNNQSLIDNSVNDVLQSKDGKVWYATDKGVSIYDEQTHLWHHGLYDKVALTLCQTHDGRILVGTYGNGVYQMHADGSSSIAYSVANGMLKTDYVYSLFDDSDGGLWIGCLDGALVHMASAYEQAKMSAKKQNGAVAYLDVNEVQSIVESPDRKHVVVGTSHGCYSIDKYSHHVSRFFYPTQFAGKDYSFFVNAMTFQDAQHVWIATDGGGLYLYDLRKHQVKNYSTAQSLPSNTIYALFKYSDGKIWMSTDKGLAFIQHGKVVNLNFFKGLECEYKRMSVAHTLDGRLIFGSSHGAVVLASKLAMGLNYQAPLQIAGIEVEGLKFDDAEQKDDWHQHVFEMLKDGKLSFSHSENTLIVNFESINYQYQHDIQYQYYLEGYDRQWSAPSSDQQARFANLAPGNYTFRVKAVGRSNGRILGEASLRIHIAQPWWNSWWAWLVYLCLLAVMAYLGWDYYKERLQRKYYDEKINFFVNTAHNIRTPLSLVLAPLADLAKDSTLVEKSRGYLEMAQRNGDKLLRMITELLDFQKIDQAKRQVHLQPIELPVFLRTQLDKFHVMASEKQIDLQLVECPAIVLTSDLSMLDLIFENLLSNAVKYTAKGGKVSLSALLSGDNNVSILVSDTGIGIPKSEKKHIFQSFYRASNAVVSQEMGSGLGLMLTRQLVQRLGGKLTFESEEGKGTTFALSLQVSTEKSASIDSQARVDDNVARNLPPQNENATSKSAGAPMAQGDSYSLSEQDDELQKDTLLFVDDNADLRQYIRMAFSNRYQVVDVESGDAALAYLKNNGECDIVVSDVMMPGMQGDELCRRIKEDKDLSWLPVILLTAKVGRDFMIEGLGLGADDYIAKPFDSAILASKIDSMLKNRRRLSQYYMERSLSLVRGEAAPVDSVDKERVGEVAGNSSHADENAVAELNPNDQAFVDKATHLVLDNLMDTDFNIDQLCREMAMSRTLFYGKLKTLTGQAPQDFIRLIRLEQAAQYLKQGDTVLDVSVKAGFVNVKYFSTVFKKHFGVSPSKFK